MMRLTGQGTRVLSRRRPPRPSAAAGASPRGAAASEAQRQYLSAWVAARSPSLRASRPHHLAPAFALLPSHRVFSASASSPSSLPGDLPSAPPPSPLPLEDPTTWHAWIYDSIPVQGMQGLLQTMQDTTGLPWWASIVVSTLAFRVALLPIVRYQAHALARLAKAGPLLMVLNQALSKRLDGIRPGDVKATTAACKTYAAGVNAALKVHNVGLLAAVASPLVQLPVFITFALANRRMIDTHVPGLETGGLAWFEDLTEADPLLILPALCLGSTYMNLELGFARLHESQTILRFLKDNLQLLLILGAPVSSTLPAGVFVYWFTSSMYGHAQHFALRNASVREVLGFPAMPVPPAASGSAVVSGKEGERPSLPPPSTSPASSGRGGGAALVDPRVLSQALQAIEKYEVRRAARLKQSSSSQGKEGEEKKETKKSGGPVLSTYPTTKKSLTTTGTPCCCGNSASSERSTRWTLACLPSIISQTHTNTTPRTTFLQDPMLPQLPTPTLDEEPLLRRPLLQGDDAPSAPAVEGKPGLRRPRQYTTHYSSASRSILIRLPNDRLVKVTQGDEEEEDSDDEDADDGGKGREGRLQTSVLQFGACGLRVCGHNVWWSGLSTFTKLIWAYYFFNWTIIFLSLSVCTLISIVYEALETGDSLGQAAIVIGLLPVITLLWLFFSFVYCVMFWGVWDDYYDLEAALVAVRRKLRSSFARSALNVLVTFCINGPVLFSLAVFGVQLKNTASDGLWRTQFFLSFASNVALVFLFFAGALLGQDHSILRRAKRRKSAAAEAEGLPTTPSFPPLAPGAGCLSRCRHTLGLIVHHLLHSEASQAIRIYMRSTIQGGGALSSSASPWGRYAAQSFLPQPVDLDGTIIDPIEEDARDDDEGGSSGEAKLEHGGKEGNYEDEEEKRMEERQSYQRRRRQLASQGVKPWPTPWHMGWYCLHWWSGRTGRRLDESSYFPLLVTLPWTLLLLTTLVLLAYTALSVRAYVLFGFMISYYMAVPLLHAVTARLVVIYCSPIGLLALDVALTLLLVAGFLLCLSLASYYLGVAVIVVILLSNGLVLLAHVPAIRDRQLPPPRTHEEGLAFHTKARTHTIITTARKWGFASILFLLVLVLSLRTVPENYQQAHDAYSAARDASRTPLLTHLSPSSSEAAAAAADTVQAPQPYAFCEQTFSRDRLSVLDLAHVSNAAYMDTTDLMTYLVENVPRHQFRNVTLVDLGQYGPVTYLFDLPHSKVLLWGIRGTNALFDLFQDLDAYSEAILIQLCTSLFPLYASPIFQPLLNKFVGTSYHLVETLATLKDVLLNRKQGSQMEITKKRKPGTRPGQGEATAGMRYYYDALANYINSTILTDPYYEGYELLFTGHSLGGGVAQIVASRLKGVAVVFSSPGVVLSRRKFDISLEDIDAYNVNVWAVGDLVPLIDQQSIKAQTIRCSPERLSYHCHSILHTIDEIDFTCGDGGNGREGGREGWEEKEEGALKA